ncbi:MAG TPA: bifunctional oligoribonuclease/PAP phosphatase NrnA [Thermoleophilia bacterium]|nr:bifunctional oligoribonuclease/PAP phosphatase NrnA [Thermoleophilia bacterium]
MSLTDGEFELVCQAMRAETLVAVAVHDDPDSDAVGAGAGLIDLFRQLGVRAALHVDAGVELPFAAELLGGVPVVEGPPPAGATLYALDCGSRERLALTLDGWTGRVIDIDHHHDNTRFGDVNLVDGEASSTSELVCLIAARLGLTPSRTTANALYAGISFDTGHFQHDSTSATTFACCAALVEAGADPHRIYRLLYESRTLASLRLWARAVAGARPAGAGRALIAVLTAADFAASGAADGETEGVVDSLRSVAGVDVAALVRPRDSNGARVSLRSEGFDVSAVAALKGGGGHRQAAGFSTDGTVEEVAAWLSTELDRRLSTASS